METLTENVKEDVADNDVVVAANVENEPEKVISEDDGRIVKLISQDARVGHFIVDVLTGIDPQEAATLNFPRPKTDDAPDIAAMVAEAEQRGYLRGKNEKIALEMKRPSQWNGEVPAEDAMREQPSILNNMRKSVWD